METHNAVIEARNLLSLSVRTRYDKWLTSGLLNLKKKSTVENMTYFKEFRRLKQNFVLFSFYFCQL